MKIISTLALAISCWLVGPAQAAKVMLTCEIAANAAGEFTVSCGTSAAPVPTQPPTPPPTPTPKPECPAPPMPLVMEILKGRSVNQYVNDPPAAGQLPYIHVWPLPVGLKSGNFSFTTNTTQTPSSLRVEISLSKCPGDVAFWKSAAGTVHMHGIEWHPCGGDGTGDQAGVKWSSVDKTFYECPIPAGEQWYLNWRSVDSSGNNTCPADRTCGQVFNWQGQ